MKIPRVMAGRERLIGMLVVLVLFAFFMAARSGSACVIVVYNQTSEGREDLQLTVGGVAHGLGNLESGESRYLAVPADAAGGGVWLSWAGRAAAVAPDTSFQPGVGRQLVVRIEAGDYVFCAEQESAWRRAWASIAR